MKLLKSHWCTLCLCVLCVSLFSCRKNTISYLTTGIVLAHYDNCGPFLKPAGNSVGDTGYVLRINYTSDQAEFYAVNDNNTYELANKPVSIAVTSLQSFDATHPAGTSLNDYFMAGPGINSRTEDVVDGFANTQDYYPTHDPDDLWLQVPPENTGPYKFIVEMVFDNGITVRDTTTSINIVR
ncbi:MAG TPA: hypothetical protein VK826_08425 [Bacteroidia bacterium]|nr:hypothetical protein [Bacteroidia bacterium]